MIQRERELRDALSGDVIPDNPRERIDPRISMSAQANLGIPGFAPDDAPRNDGKVNPNSVLEYLREV